MEILSKEETNKLDLKHGVFMVVSRIVDTLDKIEIGESVVLNHSEWTPKSDISSTYFNKMFESRNINKKFSLRRLQNGKNFALIRKQ